MASRLQDVLLRGLAAAKPAATAVANGTLYYSTDLGITEQSDGTAWFSFTDGTTSSSRIGVLGFTVDGNGSPIVTGIKGFYLLPFACTILEWTILSSDPTALSGSVVMDIWKKNLSVGYPPTVANTITAAAKPTLVGVNKGQSSTLTGWTPAIAANDVLGFKFDSVTSFTRLTVELKLQL